MLWDIWVIFIVTRENKDNYSTCRSIVQSLLLIKLTLPSSCVTLISSWLMAYGYVKYRSWWNMCEV